MKNIIWIIEKKEKDGWKPLLTAYHSVIDGPIKTLKVAQLNFKEKAEGVKALNEFGADGKFRISKYVAEK
jgi:hypothetical protein